MRRFLVPSIAALAVAGCAAYLFLGGARANFSTLFVLVAALALLWTVGTLISAGRALLAEEAPEELARATGRRRKELEREKQGLLKALKDLEFDHAMHKVSDADFHEISGAYRARTVRVMRQLDEAAIDVRMLIARDVQERLARRHPVPTAPAATNPAAVLVKAAAPERPACGACGVLNDLDAVYCKKCAARLQPAASTS